MITEKNLPREIKEIALRHKGNKDILDVFPVKVVLDEFGYYVVRYLPSMTSLVIREDGEVLPYIQVERLVLLSVALDRTADILQNGKRWKVDRGVFRGIKNTVKHFMDKYQKDAPAQVQEAMKVFLELPDKFLEHQTIIEKSAVQGVQYAKNIAFRGVVTIEEINQIKKYRDDMLRHMYRQIELLFQTEEDREAVLRYFGSKIPVWNVFDKLTYWYLVLLNRRQLSGYRKPAEERILQKIGAVAFNELPFEALLEEEEVQQALDGCKNPR